MRKHRNRISLLASLAAISVFVTLPLSSCASGKACEHVSDARTAIVAAQSALLIQDMPSACVYLQQAQDYLELASQHCQGDLDELFALIGLVAASIAAAFTQ